MRNLRFVVLIALLAAFLLYLAIQNSSLFFNRPATKKDCCNEYTKECWSCQKGLTIDEFCARNPGRFDCPKRRTECCSEQTKTCLACREGLSVENFCEKHPGKYGCPLRCCQEQKKTCLACQNRQSIADFCSKYPGQYECPKRCCGEKSKECLACVEDISVAKFCEKNPGLYGCNELPRGDIMLGIPLLNKKGYINFTASVIREYHNISEADIHLFDDSSTQYSEIILRDWYGANVRISSSQKKLGRGANIRRIFEHFVASDYKVLFLIDAETVFLRNWRDFIHSHIYNLTDGFLSLYHSSVMHNYTVDCVKPVGNLCQGDAVGQMGVALTRSLLKKVLDKHKGPFDDLNWVKIFEGDNVRILYPLKSLTMQIGQTDQGDDRCGENEVAYRFNRCELPDWIRNGIEFFFDRCTSSDEFYSPEHSMNDMEKEGRFWTRPVISYSFYGDKRRYTQIARENAARVFSVYPGWKIWIYTDGSVPEAVMKEICEFDVRVIDVSGTKIQSKMTWRFLVASEPVKMYAVRDIDSWLLPRGKAAVDEWIKSGRKFHVLRDHPNHSRYPMSGGMWGGLHDAVPDMKKILESRRMNNNYMQDMDFLNGVIWKIASKSVWVHDSHSLHKFGEDHPFPTEQKAPNLFVGNVVLWPG